MTKKHFIGLTRALADNRDAMTPEAFRALVRDIGDVCRATNPAFDRQRFEDACNATARQ